MEFLNIKIFNLKIITWIFIIISILFLLNFGQNENYSEKRTIYNFNTTWCKYSKDFQPIWDQFEKENKNNNQRLNLEIKDVKCDDDNDLCNKYPIRGFPTVILDNNGIVKEFSGKRTVEALNNFVKDI
jgi:thiol-disulfide isomerase/thioredoxin